MPPRARARYAPTSSSNVVPPPPKIKLRLGSAPAGNRNRTPPDSMDAAKRVGPTRSSRSTAGTFSERCKACATLIGPAKAAWKLPGA